MNGCLKSYIWLLLFNKTPNQSNRKHLMVTSVFIQLTLISTFFKAILVYILNIIYLSILPLYSNFVDIGFLGSTNIHKRENFFNIFTDFVIVRTLVKSFLYFLLSNKCQRLFVLYFRLTNEIGGDILDNIDLLIIQS